MLEWEENIFLGLKALYERLVKRPRERRVAAVKAGLEHRRQSMALLAQMLAGKRVVVFETDDRKLCGNDRVFLPATFTAAQTPEANAALFTIKTTLAALALRDGWKAGSPAELRALAERANDELPHLAERIRQVEAQLPASPKTPPAEALWRLLGLPATLAPDAAGVGALAEKKAPDADAPGNITEIAGKGQANVAVEEAGEDEGAGAEMPMHTFEKVETLEEYSGLSRKRDSEDELAEHAEALEEVDMRRLLRSPERPQSIYRSEVILDGAALEVAGDDAPGGGIPYPEWNHRKRAYREAWCSVFPERATRAEPAWTQASLATHAALIASLRRQFARTAMRWTLLKRQNFGSEFDLDAVVNSQVERRCGRTPSERVYLNKRRHFHDIATLMLVDLSYSTDAFLAGRRVLDIIRETLLCAGEVLDEHIARFAVAGFSSNTRRACRFTTIKRFDEPWTSARHRLGALEAQGYTRIGPALRHATRLLEKQSAERKVVLLITDGRPCDYDQYEGTHGIKDVKKAVEEADRAGVATHAFAVDKRAHATFPQMLPRPHVHIVTHPGELPRAMCDLYARLKSG